MASASSSYFPVHELARGGRHAPTTRAPASRARPDLRVDRRRARRINPVGTSPRRSVKKGARERNALERRFDHDYGRVRALKMRALGGQGLRGARWKTTRRAGDSARSQRAKLWEDDLALYVALREHEDHAWSFWPTRSGRAIPRRSPRRESVWASTSTLTNTSSGCSSRSGSGRARVSSAGVRLFGDLPFVVGRESSSRWACSRLFRHDLDLGAPPDEFSSIGQSWGLPPYDWAALGSRQHAWLRARCQLHAAYSIWVRCRPRGGVHTDSTYARGALDFDPSTSRIWASWPHGADDDHDRRAATPRCSAEDRRCRSSSSARRSATSACPAARSPLEKRRGQGPCATPSSFPVSVASYSTHDTPHSIGFYDELPASDRGRSPRSQGDHKMPPKPTVNPRRCSQWYNSPAGATLAMVLATEVFGERTRIQHAQHRRATALDLPHAGASRRRSKVTFAAEAPRALRDASTRGVPVDLRLSAGSGDDPSRVRPGCGRGLEEEEHGGELGLAHQVAATTGYCGRRRRTAGRRGSRCGHPCRTASRRAAPSIDARIARRAGDLLETVLRVGVDVVEDVSARGRHPGRRPSGAGRCGLAPCTARCRS